jgi:hypothetical protein
MNGGGMPQIVQSWRTQLTCRAIDACGASDALE